MVVKGKAYHFAICCWSLDFMGLTRVVPEPLNTKWVSLNSPSRGWFKVNFDGYVQCNKEGSVLWWGLILEDWLVQLIFYLCAIWYRNVEIRELWKTLVWTIEKILGNQIVLEDNALDILTRFIHSINPTCHLLLHDACSLHRYFFEVYIRYT